MYATDVETWKAFNLSSQGYKVTGDGVAARLAKVGWKCSLGVSNFEPTLNQVGVLKNSQHFYSL